LGIRDENCEQFKNAGFLKWLDLWKASFFEKQGKNSEIYTCDIHQLHRVKILLN